MLLSDWEIKNLSEIGWDTYTNNEEGIQNHTHKKMIVPFIGESISKTESGAKVLSYGLSSFGYDIQLADEVYVFEGNKEHIIDPKRFNKDAMRPATIHTDDDGCRYALIPANSFILGYSKELVSMPDDVLALVVTKSTIARVGGMCTATPIECGWCFTGDTLVSLANGESISFIDMVKGHENGEEYFGYSMNTDGRVSIEKLMNPRKVKTNASLVSVKLDNDEVIRCTPDHEFMLKDHSYVEAKDLKPGMSLMPLYRYIDKKGYESIASAVRYKSRPIYTHKLADEWNIKNGIYSFVEDTVRHHIDFNPANNYPTNITRMTDEDHHKVHESKPGYIEERREIGKLHWDRNKDTPGFIETIVEQLTNGSKYFWNDPINEEKRNAWLLKHKEPRPYRQLHLDKDEVYHAFSVMKSITGAATMLGCGATTLARKFGDMIAEARLDGILPFNHKVESVTILEEKEDVYCLEVPVTNNFALDAGVFVHNCGHITLEFANFTMYPFKIYLDEGCAQLLFFKGHRPLVTYGDRNNGTGGKYQNQGPNVVTAKV